MKNASFLKASCAVLLAVMVLLGCALPAFAEAEHDPDALVWESEAETAGEVKATRTYLLQNAMDSIVTELYVYPSAGTDKGENLAGDGLKRGERVRRRRRRDSRRRTYLPRRRRDRSRGA